MIGGFIGPYQLVERLGGGGFSTVYKGVEAEGGWPVAIKVLRPEYLADAQFVRRFELEAETLASLAPTPSIARCLGSGHSGDGPYLVMEFLDGEDLSQVLSDRGRMSASEVVALGRQIGDALRTAHRAGVTHRDIKPQNIRLTTAGVAKLIDWGIARPSAGTRLTQTGLFIGTPAYIAPEIWEGGEADQRTDIYALGIVLYELLTGRVPFDAETPAAIMRLHLQAAPPPLAVFRRDLPLGLESIVLKALARQPEYRFQSADELLVALMNPERAVALPTQARLQSGVPDAYAPLAYLTGQGGPVSLRQNVTILGRSPRSDISIEDGRVSAEHARIERQGPQYVLRDLRSRNGTYVNGQRVSGAVVLRPGDQVRVGQTSFAFGLQNASAVASGGEAVQPGRSPSAPRVVQRTNAIPVHVSNDAHLVAALAHGTALLTIASTVVPMVPVLVPLAIWLVARGKSQYVAFHALQAVLYQVCVVVVLIVVPNGVQPLVWLATTGYAWYGGLRCAQGRGFSYPILSTVAGSRR
jgi:serine/threonine protein kinase